MTTEEAIKMLEYIKRTGNGESEYKNDAQAIAIDKSIKALKREPCDDCVSRQAAKEQMLKYGFHAPDMTVTEFVEDELPPVTPQPKTGHWILKIEDWNKWTCSECGYTKRTDIHVSLGYDFCPKCGARMIEPQKERNSKHENRIADK